MVCDLHCGSVSVSESTSVSGHSTYHNGSSDDQPYDGPCKPEPPGSCMVTLTTKSCPYDVDVPMTSALERVDIRSASPQDDEDNVDD